METGFLDSLELTMHEKAFGHGKGAATANGRNDGSDRVNSTNALLSSSDQILKLHRKASHTINDGTNRPNNYASLEQTLDEDRERVNQILAAGKRVFTNELDAVSKADSHMNGSDEAVAQAENLFGSRKRAENEAEAERALRYLHKGVRKMTKGVESEV